MNTISKLIGFDYDNAIASEKMTVKGSKYRFTILSESLLRLEYAEDGIFENRPSLLASNRKFNEVPFNFSQDDFKIKIETNYFRLIYRKEKPFKGGSFVPDSNLKVELINSSKSWHYGHPEIRNIGAPGKELYDEKGKVSFVKGLYSSDGFVCLDDSKTCVVLENGDIIARDGEKIDLYLFMYGNDFGKCLSDYFILTGKPPMLPRYALGNWWSRDVDYDSKSLMELIKNFTDNNIPISLIFFNHNWHISRFDNKEKIQSGFTVDKEKFPNPNDLINIVHNKNIKIGLSINPTEGIFPYENGYEQYKNYVGSTENIIPFNTFEGKTYVAYYNFLLKPLLDASVDAFWLYGKKISKDEQSALNIYHTANVLNLNKRILLLTNNSLIAPHRYPVLYSGNSIVNWDTLKKVPFHNLSAANLGVSWWSHDIGGFYKGIEDNELYTRFIQLGVFSPILKLGSAGGKYYKREPWRWEIKTFRIVRDYLKLRHKLIPYLYNEMYKYHMTGMPLVKPLYYQVPKMYDDTIYRNEYYFGSEMFVAPIIDKKDTDMNRVIHRFFLPNGVWYEYFSGKKFVGGKRYLYFVKDEDYPVFVKAGGILPLANEIDDNYTFSSRSMEIQIFPGESNSFNLYEDDGISYAYRQGFFIMTNIEYQYFPNNYIVNLKPIAGKSGIIPDFRTYTIRFRNTKQPDNIIVQFNTANINYRGYVDENDFIIETDALSTTGNLVVNISGENLNIGVNRIMRDEIISILDDLQIETELKEKIDEIIFADDKINRKRVAIRRLQRKGLEKRIVNLFLKLLEYIE